jgi:ABC-type oligopeptide transport system ATPase subunit
MHRNDSYRQAALAGPVSLPSSMEALEQVYLRSRESGNEKAMARMLIEASKKGQLNFISFILSLGGGNLTQIRSPEANIGPLHYASLEGHEAIVEMFLAKGFSPTLEDQYGNTPLHLAAGNGHVDMIATILAHESCHNRVVGESQRTNLLQQLNTDGLTPLGCALKNVTPHYDVARYCLSLFSGSPPASFPDFGKAYLNSYIESILDRPTKIYVLGDSGAGKSTLTKSLQELRSKLSKITFGLVSAGRRIRSSDDRHFSGIITSEFYDPSSKRVIFYDLAGHTNYFHKELVDSAADMHHSVFIVVVSLKDGSTKVKKRLTYWLNFLYHHLCDPEKKYKPSVVLVGSHSDCRPFEIRRSADNERFAKVFTDLQELHPALVSSFSYLLRPLSLDCRKFQTLEMRQFRGTLYRTCLAIAPTDELPPCTCYILSSLLQSKDFGDFPAITLGHLADIVKTNSSKHYSPMSLYHLLPDDVFYLLDICRELEARQRVVLFENPQGRDISEVWMVHDFHSILVAIDRKLASLSDSDAGNTSSEFFNDPQERFIFSLGILTCETLGRTISEIQLAENNVFVLDINLAIDLLQHFKYTELIDPWESSGQKAFFFPSLLPNEAVEPESWEGSGFKFALSIRVTTGKTITCFLPRFLNKLLLCFIQKFILRKQSQGKEGHPSVWSRGLSWQVGGVCVHLVTNDNEIIFSMQSKPDHELDCISLRNEIICTIQEERCKWQEKIETEIYISSLEDKPVFPTRSFEACLEHWISLKEVRLSLLSGTAHYKGTSLASLLCFEPAISLLSMNPLTRDYFSDVRNSRAFLGRGDLLNIYESFGRTKEAIVTRFHLPDLGTESTSSEGAMCRGSSQMYNSKASISTHTATSMESEHAISNITCGRFLDHMNSLSIFDFKEYVNEMKVCKLVAREKALLKCFLSYTCSIISKSQQIGSMIWQLTKSTREIPVTLIRFSYHCLVNHRVLGCQV